MGKTRIKITLMAEVDSDSLFGVAPEVIDAGNRYERIMPQSEVEGHVRHNLWTDLNDWYCYTLQKAIEYHCELDKATDPQSKAMAEALIKHNQADMDLRKKFLDGAVIEIDYDKE